MATTRRLRSSAASPRSILYDNTKRAVARISMKLHRDLEITQKTAWHLALHRLRKAVSGKAMGMFQGPVEVDETYMGGRRENMPKAKRVKFEGRGIAWRDGYRRGEGSRHPRP